MPKRVLILGAMALVLTTVATPAVGAPSVSDLRALVVKSLRLARDGNATAHRAEAKVDKLAAGRIAGPSGPVGPRGANGLDGATGAQGLPGADGQPGAQGPQGQSGAQGPKGDTGTQGAKGDTGDKGADGAQGLRGADGARGADGSQGPQGDQGPQGEQGPQGPAGAASSIWARIDAEGGIVVARHVDSAHALDVGVYEIVFERDLEDCALTVTPRGGEPVMTAVEVDRHAGNVAVVRSFGFDGKEGGAVPRASAFDVGALCSEKPDKAGK